MPTEAVCDAFKHIYAVFHDIESSESKVQFLKETKCKQILILMAINSLESVFFFNSFEPECECGMNVKKLFTKILSPFCNIILNNYTKFINDTNNFNRQSTNKSSTQRKLENFKLSR